MQSTIKKNQGLSLIEMMVSMVLGLFLIGGLTSMYFGSKKTDKVRAAVSDIEENARMTLNNIRSSLQHAGYKSVDNIPLDKPFQTPTDGAIANQFCRDQEVMITNSSLTVPPVEFSGYTRDGDLNDGESDRVTAVYHADNPNKGPLFHDCIDGDYSNGILTGVEVTERQVACSTDPNSGVNNPWNSKIYNGIYVKKSDKTLRCFGSRSESGSQVLAENVENMQIRYGVTKTVNGVRVTRFRNASDVETYQEWESVTSVQVAILVASKKEVLENPEAKQFELLDEVITISADRRLYRTYSTTIHLPNRSRRELQTITRSSAEAT